jgi:hypothetical protein
MREAGWRPEGRARVEGVKKGVLRELEGGGRGLTFGSLKTTTNKNSEKKIKKILRYVNLIFN